MFKLKDSDLGNIMVSREVIETIAGLAAVDCYGLVGMVAQDLQSGITSMLGRETIRKGVQVRDTEDGLVVDLYVIVGYGVKIKEVAHNVMQKVGYVLENVAGIPVAMVNVNVKGVKVLGE